MTLEDRSGEERMNETEMTSIDFSAMRASAVSLNEMFQSLVAAGFSVHEALYFMAVWMANVPQKGNEE